MAHFQKHTAAALGHLLAHFERQMKRNKETGELEYVKFSNQSIDAARTHTNYNLGPDRDMYLIDFVQKRLSEVKVQKREDVNIMCTWIVTLPKKDEPYTDQEERAFFQEVYDHLTEMYEEENVICAYVHRDEEQPHLHFAFIPVVDDEKWNAKHPDRPRQKVSAKECVSRLDLELFHKALQIRLDAKFGNDVYPILNGATIGGNRTVTELKAMEEMNIIQHEIFDLLLEKDKLQTEIAQLEYNLPDLREEVERLEETKAMYDTVVDDYNKEILNKGEMLDKVTQKLEEAEDKVADLKNEQLFLETTIEKLNEDIDDLILERNALVSLTIKTEKVLEREIGEDISPLIEKEKENQRYYGRLESFFKFCQQFMDDFIHFFERFKLHELEQEKPKKKMLRQDSEAWNMSIDEYRQRRTEKDALTRPVLKKKKEREIGD